MLRLALCLLLQCLAAAQAAAQDDTYPPLDGMGNNKANTDWGRANMPYLEQQVPFRANDTNSLGLTGANRPSAREISLALTNSPYYKASNKYNTSYLLSALGQIITKDISYAWNDRPSPDGTAAPIPIPRGDPLFSNFKQQRPVAQGSRTMLEFNRTHAITNNATGQRQPLNIASSFLDASMLYGTDANTSRTLRAGTAGRLLDDGDRMLPYNYNPTTGGVLLQMSNVAGRVSNTELRMSGHPHVNQNPFPLVMNTLLLREHNRRAQQAENQHPDWTDEQLFQTARKWVIAHMQRIAFVDYMVELGIPLPPYTGYNASVNPTVDLFFGTVAYRYGHATLTDVILRLDENWGEHAKGHLPLMQTYYNPDEVLSAGIEPIIRGLIAMPQGEVETRWSSAVAGNLWGFSTVNGTDLVALNIQRGRDHGIPDYNTCRRALGLKPIKTFAELTADHDLAVTLEVLYKDINNVDAYIGGLAEPHYQKAHVGELFYFSILDQFKRLRDGDWWYYENKDNGLFTSAEIEEVQRTSLRDIIQRNTNITNLPDNIFSAVGLQGNSAASGGSSGGQQQLLLSNLMNGKGQMKVRRADTNGWVRVKVTSPGDGWLGFGVAKAGSSFPMIGADLVIGHLINGAPVVKRYTAPAHAPPVEAPDAGQLKVIGFTQTNGQTTLEFERPLAASSNAAADGSIAIPLDSPVVLLMARGPGEDVGSMAGYHGVSDRDYKTVSQLFSGADATSAAAAASDAIEKRKAHGILMAVNFIIVLPLGALAARQLRSHWLRNSGFRASLFYVHVATQVAGVIMATVGFVIATRFFGTKYYRVAFHHGQIGIAILTLVYSQLLMGFVRPSASSTTSVIRRVWDYAHSLLGRSAMLLGVLNVIVGVIIFSISYGGDLVVWGGLCAAGLLAIQLVQYTLDRHEKNTILAIESSNLQQRLEADLPNSANDFPGSHHSGMHKDISPDAIADLPGGEQPVLYDVDTKPSGFRDNKPNGRSFVSMIMGQQAPTEHHSSSGMPPFSSNLPFSGNSNGELQSEHGSGQQGEGFMGRLTESILKRHEQSVPPPGADNIGADPVVGAKPWSKGGDP